MIELTTDDTIDDVVGGAKSCPLLPLSFLIVNDAHSAREQRDGHTKCQTREAAIVTSVIAENANQMMTTTWNFWNSSSSGTLLSG